PAAAALLGIAVSETPRPSLKIAGLLGVSALLFCFFPAIVNALPEALSRGVRHAPVAFPLTWVAPAVLGSFCIFVLEKASHRICAIAVVAGLAVASTIQIAWRVYPQLDQAVSARPIALASRTCVDSENRSRRYGLQYYVGRTLSDCN